MTGPESVDNAAAPLEPAGGCSSPDAPGASMPGRATQARARNLAFLIVVVLLGGGAMVQMPLQRWLKVASTKAPLPPRQPLGSLDKNGLGPYRFVRADVIGPESVEALGTEMYLWWVLEDPRRPAGDPRRTASLFITYYTGGPELAVHRPEECYQATGFALSTGSRDERRRVETLPAEPRELPLRIVTFAKTGLLNRTELTVAYTFFCNGRFTSNYQDIRFWSTSPRVRHAFFSKVEVSFGAEGAQRVASAEETADGAYELMRHVLPRLMNDIWPDFEAAEGGP
ncbi:MAG: exosortase-associated EpsI family protein [Phycisphaerales bacterium]|nr:exosortase-associated EpsI family protein [Phycisphaerales bacterium]